MYRLPFVILREKVPFIEFVVRNLQLFVNPKVESETQFSTGDMKYALWDIVLSLTLTGIVITLIAMVVGSSDFVQALSIFGSQFEGLIHFGYYGYFSTAIFFIISLVILTAKERNKTVFKRAFLASMHYARYYAFVLILFVPLFYYLAYQSIINIVGINEYIKAKSLESWVVLLFFFVTFMWACARPLHLYLKIFKNKLYSYLIVFVMTGSAYSASTLAPNLPGLSMNNKILCELFKKSPEYNSLSGCEKNIFDSQCKKTHITKP